jgi:RNA polymerase sigma-70 factor (ECF subfamily)
MLRDAIVARDTHRADVAMTRFAAGDDAAFTIVYSETAPRLLSYLRRRTSDQSCIEDLMQDTFLQMHRSRRTFIPGAEVLPWAFAISRRLFINWCQRSRSRGREVSIASDNHVDTDLALASTSGTGEQLLAAQETGKKLVAALAALSEPQRATFHLVKGEGLSLVETARVLGTTVMAIKLRMHRVYASLRTAAGVKGSPSD